MTSAQIYGSGLISDKTKIALSFNANEETNRRLKACLNEILLLG